MHDSSRDELFSWQRAGWGLAVAVLLLGGIIGLFSFGLPLLVLGVTLAALRRHPRVLWPAVAAEVAFVLTLVVAAPRTCAPAPAGAPASCPGPGPALALAGAIAATAALAAWWLAERRLARDREPRHLH